jgi:dienelactone hydrolase
VLAACVAIALPVAAGASSTPQLFAYDSRAPLAVRIESTLTRGDVTVRALSFSVEGSTRLGAYLVAPKRPAASVPGVLYVPGRRQTREFFLSEAVALAGRGAVALVVGDLPSRYPTFNQGDGAVLNRRVVALRRAVDLLTVQPGVDRTRLAFVGHSDGAELGGILAGVDRRMAAYVLMSGGGIWDRSNDAAYNRVIARNDADNYIGHAAPAALFYQSGLSDQFVPDSDGVRYQQRGSEPKTVRWYDADHMLNEQARKDRQAWLAARLHLSAR